MTTPKTPLLTTDIIIELVDRADRPIVLIERKSPPLGLAIPGGFVDVGETVEHAAVREAREETTLDVSLRTLLGVYSDPDRDPRGHTASVVYVAEARGQPVANDDASKVIVVDVCSFPDQLVFDHARILADYLKHREHY